MSRIAVVPGSFDPVTLGHLDVIERAAAIFDEVHVVVVHNPGKTAMLPIAQRVTLIEHAIADRALPQSILVTGWSVGLLVDYCRDIGARAVIKGLRSGTDFAYELPMALMNRHLTELETIFVPGDPRFEHVSSSLIREVHALGGDVSGLVPAAVLEAMDAKRG